MKEVKNLLEGFVTLVLSSDLEPRRNDSNESCFLMYVILLTETSFRGYHGML